jgi:hypothetical protein
METQVYYQSSPCGMQTISLVEDRRLQGKVWTGALSSKGQANDKV